MYDNRPNLNKLAAVYVKESHEYLPPPTSGKVDQRNYMNNGRPPSSYKVRTSLQD